MEITLSKDEIDEMDVEEFQNLLRIAVNMSGTAVVRRADGSIKYDNPELAGTYGEENLGVASD